METSQHLSNQSETFEQSSTITMGKHARKHKWSRYNNTTFYLFILPWIFGFVALTIAPMTYAMLVSFTDFAGFGNWHWIGVANYQAALRDPDTWLSLRHTLVYMIIIVPASIAGGLGLALLVNRPIRGMNIFRAVLYLPSIIPIVAGTLIWRTILNHDTGPMNAIVERLTGGHDVNWFSDTNILISIIILILWGIGGGMVISLAGLQGIPQELVEATQIDGANMWQSFRSVTLPLLSPILFFQMVLGVIGALQVLVQPILLDGSSLYNSSRNDFFYMIDVYTQFFYNYRYGYGAALLWILFAFILMVTLLVFRSSSFWVYYEVDHS